MASPPPTPSAGKTSKPGASKSGKKKRPRRRAGCGVFFFLLLLGGGGGLGYYVYQVGWDQAWQPAQDLIDDWEAGREARRQRQLEKERGLPAYTDNGPERVIDMKTLDLRPLHQQDPRWEKALTMGDAGVARFAAAVKKHYDPKAEGDPFWFRSEQTASLENIDEAVALLQDMREDYADNDNAVYEIDRELRRYEKTLGSLGPKSHRR